MSSTSGFSWRQSLQVGVPCVLTTGLVLLIRKGKASRCLERFGERLGLLSNRSGDDSSSNKQSATLVYTDPNFPLTADGRVHHLGVKRGEVANRILSVGDHGRAERLAAFLDNVTVIPSSRGFKTYTGLFNGVPVSIIATGMGTPMMDFVVRETRAVVDGEMAIIRYGTSGGLGDVPPGWVVVASEGACNVTRDPDAIHQPKTSSSPPYKISSLAMPDKTLSQKFCDALREAMPAEYGVTTGVNATADSFYSSQGRTTALFDDQNATLLDDLEKKYPNAAALEMETFQLFELARSSYGSIKAAAAAIPLSNRKSRQVITSEGVRLLECKGGEAALRALTSIALKNTMKSSECIW
eukprot:gb/GECG01000066.1/.p1 GENE.gb/GECG01000066.1/~~gb/GECG01000066.1/.p1  ORF type:complete len:354 (+),score=44.55 gb/GECG01000066.1/:1-1062(+)